MKCQIFHMAYDLLIESQNLPKFNQNKNLEEVKLWHYLSQLRQRLLTCTLKQTIMR